MPLKKSDFFFFHFEYTEKNYSIDSRQRKHCSCTEGTQSISLLHIFFVVFILYVWEEVLDTAEKIVHLSSKIVFACFFKNLFNNLGLMINYKVFNILSHLVSVSASYFCDWFSCYFFLGTAAQKKSLSGFKKKNFLEKRFSKGGYFCLREK